MDNKLSELSKPVAYEFDRGVMGQGDFKYGAPQMHSTAKDENARPLYSQEYVSALLAGLEFEKQNNAGFAGMVEDYETKLEAKNKRIAELEGQLQSGFTPEALAQEERAENAEQRVSELEAQLSTPVVINLPERRDNSYDWDGAPPSEAFNICRSICGLMFRQQLRAAGFTVEGDE